MNDFRGRVFSLSARSCASSATDTIGKRLFMFLDQPALKLPTHYHSHRHFKQRDAAMLIGCSAISFFWSLCPPPGAMLRFVLYATRHFTLVNYFQVMSAEVMAMAAALVADFAG